MTKKKKRISLFVLIVGLLATAWAVISTPVTSAHEGHKHANAPASAKKLKNPLMTDAQNIEAGKTLFNKYCASCHGEDGKGKTETAARMKSKPADLTASEMHGITDGEIYYVVTNGIKKSGMPSFKARTATDERWQLTLYVKHLMGEHPHAEHDKQ